MSTSLSEICDLFLTKVNDYRLTTIYNTSGSLATSTYIEPWVLASIVEFSVCNQDLSYTPTTATEDGYFAEDLTLENKEMLATITTKYWLKKVVQDILQMNNAVTDHDFRMFSQAQNLKEKREYYNSVCEEVSQMITRYEYKYNDWTTWKNTL